MWVISLFCYFGLTNTLHWPFQLKYYKKKCHKPLAAVVKLHQDHCVSLSSGLFGLTLMLQKINLLISNSFSTNPITLNTLNLTPCYSGFRYLWLHYIQVKVVRNRSCHISAGNPAWVFFRFLSRIRQQTKLLSPTTKQNLGWPCVSPIRGRSNNLKSQEPMMNII